MAEDTIEPFEQERLRIYATQQLLVATIRAVVDLVPAEQQEGARAAIAANFESLAAGYDVRGVSSPEKVEACREILLQHGLELLGQVRPR
jgi:hypothetical protein